VWPAGWTLRSLCVALRRPAVITWLIILTPSALWFVVGGWPQTAGLQSFMTQPIVWKVLFPMTVLAQAWIAWRTIVGMRRWSQARAASIGDDAAVIGLRIACGIGAVSLGTFSLLRMMGGLAPGSSILASLHAQGAANRLTPTGGSMVADSAGAFAPPPPTLDLPDQASSSSSSNPNSNANAGSPSPANKQAPPPAPKLAENPSDDERLEATAREMQQQIEQLNQEARRMHDHQQSRNKIDEALGKKLKQP
jgi:hypothetical protein